MRAEPPLMAYLRVLEAHRWLQVPTTRDAGLTFFARGTHLLDRIEVFKGRWSHHHFDAASWLTHVKARGDDVASLDKYLSEHFRSDGR